jgi:hypothetical protein
MSEQQINWTVGLVATAIALLLGASCEQFMLMFSVCSLAWAVVMYCNWLDAKCHLSEAIDAISVWTDSYFSRVKMHDADIDKKRELEAECNLLRSDVASMQGVINKKDTILQIQSDTINDIVSLVEEYRECRPRRLPWHRVAKIVGILGETEAKEVK